MRAILLLATVASLALAGCMGNGDDTTADPPVTNDTNSTPTPTPTPTPEECGGVQPPVGPPCVEPPTA